MNLTSEWAGFKSETCAKFIILFPWIVFANVVLLLIFDDSLLLHRTLIAILCTRLWISE